MVKAKSLVNYKLTYDPDSTKKTKFIEVESNGATRTFAIPVVSGEKNIEFQINEQLPLFFELVNALGFNGQEKFNRFGTYLSGSFKSAWENELRTSYAALNE